PSFIHSLLIISLYLSFFFFNHPATTEIYTLSLHTLFRSSVRHSGRVCLHQTQSRAGADAGGPHDPSLSALARTSSIVPTRRGSGDRKSTRLNSSHVAISYAVFCLKKKNIHRYLSQVAIIY